MEELRIRQIKSAIGQKKRVKRTLWALGLRKPGDTVLHKDSPVLRGMWRAVRHLVELEEVKKK